MSFICGIYKIENNINGKVYIGQSSNILKRWIAHKNTYSNPNSKNYDYPIYRAIRKYGLENFSFEILEECSVDSLNEREKYWIQYYQSYSNGYNQDEGGNSASHFTKLSKEKVLEIIEVLKNSKESSEKIGERFGVSGRTIRAINTGEQSFQEGISYPVRDKLFSLNVSFSECEICGKITKNKKYCSQECSHIAQQKASKPTRKELKKLIRTTSFIELGRRYNVSDNAIRKWCKSYNLPFKTKDIKRISDEDWDKI